MERPPIRPPLPNPAPLPDRALLKRIDARLERIEGRLARFDALTEQAPGLLALAGDVFDEWAARTGDVDERLRGLLGLLERITRPATLARLEQGLDALEQLPGLVAMAGDTFDELVRAQNEAGLDTEKLVHDIGRIMAAVTRLIASDQVQRLLESDLLLPGAIESLGDAARALAGARGASEQRLGLFGLLGALRDPDVQRALGFFMDVARRFGHHVDHEHPALTAGE